MMTTRGAGPSTSSGRQSCSGSPGRDRAIHRRPRQRNPPWPKFAEPEVLKRLYHEKRGFLLLLGGAYDEAAASYDRAYEAAGTHHRGLVKVRLGRCLVDYLAANSAEGRDRIGHKTDLLGQEALKASSPDVAQTAELNAEVMRRGGSKLIPYEIL